MSWVPGCRRPSRVALLAGALLLVAAACEPEATPLPVLPVATTPAPEQTAEASARTVLTVDTLTLNLLPDDVRARLNAAAEVDEVETMTASAGGPAISVLPFTGATPTVYTVNIAAQFDGVRAPLNNPELAAALAGFLAARSTDELRLALANAGFPDGITLSVAVEPALWPLLQEGLGGGPVRWVPVANDETAQVIFAAGVEADAVLAAGGALTGVLPLYAAGLTVALDADGLPVFAPHSPVEEARPSR